MVMCLLFKYEDLSLIPNSNSCEKLGTVMGTCDCSAGEAEIGRSQGLIGQ